MGTVRVGAPMKRIALDIMGPLNEKERKNRYVLVIQEYEMGRSVSNPR